MSRCFLNIFKEGHPATSLGNLCHCLVTLAARKYLLMFRGTFLGFSLCPQPLVLSLGTTGKSLDPSSLHPLFRCLHTLIRSPRTFSYPAWAVPVSQPFLGHEMLWTLNHLCGASLDSLHYVHVFLVVRSSALDSALQACPQQCWVEGKDPHPRPAGNALCDAAQDIICLLCSKGTLLRHVQPGERGPPGPFLWSCFPAEWPPSYTGAWRCSSPGHYFQGSETRASSEHGIDFLFLTLQL